MATSGGKIRKLGYVLFSSVCLFVFLKFSSLGGDIHALVLSSIEK